MYKLFFCIQKNYQKYNFWQPGDLNFKYPSTQVPTMGIPHRDSELSKQLRN